jgi:protein-tyrosine phosphatase
MVERDIVHAKLTELRAELERQRVPITVLPGNEVRLESARFFYDAMEAGKFCYLADDPRFLLLEQAWEGFCPDTLDIVKTLTERGTKVIIAHPERHLFFRAKPQLLEAQLALGAWTQVSVGSLLGENGPDAQAFAFDLLDRGLVHTLATDAHNMTRKPILSLGFQAVAERAGVAAAQAIRERLESILPAYA